VTIDLGMLSEYDYYTGIIFRGYTYGTGDPIVRGGRYDRLISQFGKDAASVGFAIVLDELLLALSRQKIDVPDTVSSTMVLYEPSLLGEAIRAAGSLRNINRAVCLMKMDPSMQISDYENYCRRHHIDSILHILDHERLEKIDTLDGSIREMPIPAF
jgi:ATP phosphoribosyltransferase regulatory subunit